MKDFSKKNSHEENVKISIDQILGSDSVIRRAKKTAEDNKKTNFIDVIDQLIALEHREFELDNGFHLDFTIYNSAFFLVINSLFQLTFTKSQIELINFYLYERVTPEGFLIDLEDAAGNIMDLSTPEKLYLAIKKIK